jgi:Flp pilus assembly protein TadD
VIAARLAPRPGFAMIGAAAALALPLSLLTRERNLVFRDQFSYWADIVRKDPESAPAQMSYGIAVWQKGNKEEAERHLREAVRLSPRYADAYTTLGLFLEEQRDVKGAAAAFDKAVELAPDLPQVWYYRGWWFLQHKLYESAAGDLERAVRLGTAPVRERVGLAEAQLKLGRVEHGLETIRAGAALDREAFVPLAPVLLDASAAAISAGELDRAEAMLRECLEVSPGFALAETNLGIVANKRGDVAGARAAHDRAAALGPREPGVFLWRGRFRAERGDLAGAAEDFRRASELQVDLKRSPVTELAELAGVLIKEGRRGEAEEAIRRGEALDAKAFAELRAKLATMPG